jgi:alpha-tubulin suppressor-like RCC1 family protein
VSGGYTWASVAVGKYHTVGVTTSGDAYAWGNSSEGQTGNGTLENSNVPVLIIPRVIVY